MTLKLIHTITRLVLNILTLGPVVGDEFELMLQQRGSSQRRVLLQQMKVDELGHSLDRDMGGAGLNRLQNRVVGEDVLLFGLN